MSQVISASNIKGLFSNWRYLMPFIKQIGYIGWLGDDNLGDQAMYYAAKKSFSGFHVAPFKQTVLIEYAEKTFKKYYFNAVMLGGGTLIYSKGYVEDIIKYLNTHDIAFTFGTGVEDLAFWSKVDPGRVSNSMVSRWNEGLGKCKYIGVRGPLSKQILHDNGIRNVEIIGDTALSLALDDLKRKKFIKKIGINIGVSCGNVYGSEEAVLEYTVKLVKLLLQKKWEVVFLPVWKRDLPYIEEAVKRIGVPVPIFYEYNLINKTMDLLQGCDLFIGEKLHSVILAMCAATPSIMLEYRPKCLDFMMSMEMEEFNIRTDRLSLDDIIDMIDKLFSNMEYYQDIIFGKVYSYKELQKQRADMIYDMISKNQSK